MKKQILLFVLMLMSVAIKAQQTYDVHIGGIFYDIFTSSHTATVTYYHDLNSQYDHNYEFYTGNVIIPSEFNYKDVTYHVTKIDGRAFHGCKNLISITIPNSIVSIGSSAFTGCTGLTAVHISDIEAWCKIDIRDDKANPLYYAHHLYLNDIEITDLVVPNGVTKINNRVFSWCSGLNSVSLSESVTSIGSSAFEGCSGLENITIPSNVTSIGEKAFEGCNNLSSVSIHSKEVGSWFSEMPSIKEVHIGEKVTSIGNSAFKNCRGLTSIVIPNNVTSIGYSAFYGCI